MITKQRFCSVTKQFLPVAAKPRIRTTFFSLRCALADSSLTAQTFDLWVKKFGVRILEGWVPQACGAAVSFNTPLYNRWGSCGALLPGVSYRNGVLKSDSFAGGKFVPSSALQFDDDGYLCPPADC